MIVYLAEVISRDVGRDLAVRKISQNRVIDNVGYFNDFLFDVIKEIFRNITMTDKNIATD